MFFKLNKPKPKQNIDKIKTQRQLQQHQQTTTNDCIVVPHNGLGDHINTISMCNYLSTIYDNVYHMCNPKLHQNVKLFYNNPKVTVYNLVMDYNDNFFADEIFVKIQNIYILGFHQTNPFIQNLTNKNIYGLANKFDPNTIPHSFYRQVDIDVNVFYNFMFLSDIEESTQLFDMIKDMNYCFVSCNTSHGDTFTINDIVSRQTINIDDTLVINPVKNVYNENHKFYDLANHFVMKPIAFYTKTIKNASTITVSNSCFMCLLLNLKVNTSHVYYISIHDYGYLFDPKHKFTQLIKKM
jgi:hypothetical protein